MPLVAPDVLAGEFDVCIVGAGPAGLACAFACHDRGLKVLVLDAGGERPVPGNPDILAAEIANTKAHDPVELVAASALGGTAHWWGGRCVPLDPVDFRKWPITWEEMLPWWRYAAELIGAGAVVERPAPGKFANLSSFDATTAESWTPTPVLNQRWRQRVRAKDGPAILLRARVTGLQHLNGAIASIDVLTPGGVRRVTARAFVLACGGLGCIRLMLLAQRSDPSLFGGRGGPLGRGYMGHLTGSIADLVFDDPSHADAFGFFKAAGRYPARRRILPRAQTVETSAIGNTAFWIASPPFGSAEHGSSAASARFLAGCAVRLVAGDLARDLPALGPHFANVGKAPLTAAAGLTEAAWALAGARLTRQQHLPRRFLSSGGGGWRLVYHSEQHSDPANRIGLSDDMDSVGLPKLRIDFRFSERDAESVVRTHDLLDGDLREAGAGRLRWAEGDRQALVAASARDGYHQVGGAAMGARADRSVVDRRCKVHGLANMWVASSSVFPTSGQANPTLTIVALACRVAEQVVLSARPPYRAEAPTLTLQQAS